MLVFRHPVQLLFTADVIYDAVMISSLIATPNRRSAPRVPEYGMAPGRRMAGAAHADRGHSRVKAE
jgi:hypothetical protein